MNNEKEIIGLIDSFYAIISGKAGQNRNWNGFRKLFYNGAQLIPYKFDESCTVAYDVNTYIENRLSPLLETNDFYEFGYDYDIEIFKNIAQVHSKYDAKTTPESKSLIKSGTSFVQLINTGTEWKIINMLWQDK